MRTSSPMEAMKSITARTRRELSPSAFSASTRVCSPWPDSRAVSKRQVVREWVNAHRQHLVHVVDLDAVPPQVGVSHDDCEVLVGLRSADLGARI